jgi:molybdopterin synthase sulfur carrier subunit
MAHVVLMDAFKRFTGGELEFDLEVETIGHLMRVLGERFPEMKPHLEEGVAVAIDGQIYQETWTEKIPPDADVHLIPQIGGG